RKSHGPANNKRPFSAASASGSGAIANITKVLPDRPMHPSEHKKGQNCLRVTQTTQHSEQDLQKKDDKGEYRCEGLFHGRARD
ncbi:MAG: hypothetical protein AAF212_11800, partial [Verrucomicrobiota bacterium]